MTDNAVLPTNVDWALDALVATVTGAHWAMALSTDGMVIQRSAQIDRDAADGLAAMASSLASITRTIADRLAATPVTQTVVEMENRYLAVTAAGTNACLAMLIDEDGDLGQVAFEMNRLVKRIGQHLSTRQRQTPLMSGGGR